MMMTTPIDMKRVLTVRLWISRLSKRNVTLLELCQVAFRSKYETIKQPQFDSCMVLMKKTNEVPIFVQEFIRKKVYSDLIVRPAMKLIK